MAQVDNSPSVFFPLLYVGTGMYTWETVIFSQ